MPSPWITRGLTLAVVSQLTVACGLDSTSPPGTLPQPGNDSGTALTDVLDGSARPDIAALPDGSVRQFRVAIGPIMLDPGQERTVCIVRRMGNTTPQLIRRVTANLGEASHHMIIYRVPDRVERLAPYPCQPFSAAHDNTATSGPVMIAQQPDARLELPAGVGLPTVADQFIQLEFHTLNTTSAPIESRGEVTFDTVDASDAYAAAELLFSGTLSIQIPPRTPPTAPVQVHHVTRVPDDARVFALTSHTHHLGILATVSQSGPGGMGGMVRDFRELHRSTNWAEPPLTTFDPPLTFTPMSGEALHLVCSYVNPTDRAVNFGLSANDEMCFLWAYYYVPR
jgi:hypothetical protein